MPIIPNINNEALQLLPDIALWKQQIADAINDKGGEAEPTQAFTELAEEIKDIQNFDQWARLAGVLAGYVATDTLSGHNQNVDAGSITKIIDRFGTFKILKQYCFRYWDLLEEVILPNCDIPYAPNINQNYFDNCNRLKKVILPNTKNLGVQLFYKCNSLEFIEFGVLIYSTSNALYADVKTKLRNVTVGEGSDVDLTFQLWTATSVIAEGQSGIDELNSNLYNNMLTKLYDHSGDGETRILRIGWLDYVSEENIAYATAKGWTLTT